MTYHGKALGIVAWLFYKFPDLKAMRFIVQEFLLASLNGLVDVWKCRTVPGQRLDHSYPIGFVLPKKVSDSSLVLIIDLPHQISFLYPRAEWLVDSAGRKWVVHLQKTTASFQRSLIGQLPRL